MLTVAVPTRNRSSRLTRFLRSLDDSGATGIKTLVVHDSPTEMESVLECQQQYMNYPLFNSIVMPNKSSLAELWNYCIAYSDTDWVLVCNDDAVFMKDWDKYLLDTIASEKFLQINLLHYGGFCINKRMILRNGWFDERFRGGGFEDNDWQLRIFEGGHKKHVDISHDYKFMDHLKVSDDTNWRGVNNDQWIMEKWGRIHLWDWHQPSFRVRPEIDWHPAFTKRYENKFQEESRIPFINANYVNSRKEIFH
jgi:glycosyltransferase involved in cell wall biosynthesis